ncbi:hypothetical protein V9L05_09385 [Bernardetia sp. Wsw4-3y2]|uniref:hypothetical protein n=1 Tax=Bernardetia sp. Wsw4-3y2 TaxID=3127471 RepID=UPI0030CCD39A
MNSKLNFVSFLLIFFSLIACTSNSDNKDNTQVVAENKEPKDSTLVLDEEQKKTITNLELLQGKWQSTDDETNFLKFENNHRMEIAEGMTQWSDEIFTLSDKCTNESDKSKDLKPEKDLYITSESSDMCWYIIDLNEEILTIAYMARGNTLAYKRVK